MTVLGGVVRPDLQVRNLEEADNDTVVIVAHTVGKQDLLGEKHGETCRK